MDICDSLIALDLEVRRFMEHVPDVKEESITDFLIWKWRDLDARFNFLRVHPFNHEQESSTTGADFDLELWLVGRRHHVALAVQAKKFVKRSNSYVAQLRYPRDSKAQMTRLLSYATLTNRRPFYFIYSRPGSTFATMCGSPSTARGAVFTADARRLEEYADGKYGRRVTRDQLLAITNPFPCMFCCPLAQQGGFFDHYFGYPFGSRAERTDEELPLYVQRLLQRGDSVIDVEASLAPLQFRFIGVYDLRGDA